MKATMVLLKVFIGSGVLSLPFALAHAGFVMGVSGLLLLALLSIQGILIMVDCALLVEKTRGKGCQTYPALATALAGPKLGSAVSAMCCLTQLGVCCVMLNFVATSVLAIAPCEKRAHLLVTHGGTPESELEIVNESACFGLRLLPAKRVFIALILPVFVGLSWLPSINALAPLAKIANLFMLIVITLTLFFATQAYYRQGEVASCVAWPPSTQSYLLFIGNCFYAFEGAATVIPVVFAIQDRPAVQRVVANALFFVLFVQMVVAVTCYVAFEDINSGSITAVLATNKTIPGVSVGTVTLMNVLVVLAVVFSFPLQLFPAIQLLESAVGIGTSSSSPSSKSGGVGKAPAAAAASGKKEEKQETLRQRKEEDAEAWAHRGGQGEREALDDVESDDRDAPLRLKAAEGAAPVEADAANLFFGGRRSLEEDDHEEEEEEEEDALAQTFDYRMVDAYDLGDGDGGIPLPQDKPGGGSFLPVRQVLFRTCVVLSVGAVTEAIPDLGLIIDILGAVFGSFLVIILPNYLSVVSRKLLPRQEQEMLGWPWTRIFTIVFTSICAVFAAGAAMEEIVAGTESH